MEFLRTTLTIVSILAGLSLHLGAVVGQDPSPNPAPVVPAPSPAPLVGRESPPQVISVITALRDAGQFGAIAGLLDGLNMKSITPYTTWLLPNDEAFSGTDYPRNVTAFLNYHVIREQLPFSRLMTLNVGSRLPTFLENNTIVVTSNQRFNYSLDNAMVVVPDLYSDGTIAVHGMDAVLSVAEFNPGFLSASPISAPASLSSTPDAALPSAEYPTTGAPSGSRGLSPLPLRNITFPSGTRRLIPAPAFVLGLVAVIATYALHSI